MKRSKTTMMGLMLTTIALGTVVGTFTPGLWGGGQAAKKGKVKNGKISVKIDGVARDTTGRYTIRIEVRNKSDKPFTFTYGGYISQVFGVYLLGPWGWVQPKKPVQWMQQNVAQGKLVKIRQGKPFRVEIPLNKFFKMKDIVTPAFSAFRLRKNLTRFQINVKFFVLGESMIQPADSGPVWFFIDLKNKHMEMIKGGDNKSPISSQSK